jgi:hypothetical protein
MASEARRGCTLDAVSRYSYPVVGLFQLALHPALSKHSINAPFASRSIALGTIVGMYDVGDSLRSALEAARSGLSQAQAAVARANAGGGAARSADTAMAQTAQAAIFSEVLLSVEHARFEAIKEVTK